MLTLFYNIGDIMLFTGQLSSGLRTAYANNFIFSRTGDLCNLPPAGIVMKNIVITFLATYAVFTSLGLYYFASGKIENRPVDYVEQLSNRR